MKIYPHNLVRKVVEGQLKLNINPIRLGDTVRVRVRSKDRRTQFYLGTLVAKNGIGRNSTITIRSEFGGGIVTERTIYLYSQLIEFIAI